MRRPRLAAALVALSLFVATAPAVQATGRPVARIDVVSTGASWLGSLASQAFCLLGVKAYCGPRLGASGAFSSAKLGCRTAPDGRCSSENRGSSWGCTVDPNGRCVGSPSTSEAVDRGCTIDPNGQCLP